MASSQRPASSDIQNAEVLTVLTLKYLDGVIGDDELDALQATLQDSASGRDLFVQLCHLHAYLREAFRVRGRHVPGKKTGASGEPASEPAGDDTVVRGQTAGDTVRVRRRRDTPPPEA